MNYKLGKKPARPGAVKLMLRDYLDLPALPTPPKVFGHTSLVPTWGMLANDNYGDCVFAGAAHETMLWNQEASRSVPFDDKAVLSDYSVVTGFNPADPASDGGTDVQQAASYRRTTGIVDGLGNRHKVLAYVALTPGHTPELYLAMYLFGAVGVGVRFPETAMQQFDNGEPWHIVPGAQISGGHYIPCVARDHKTIMCVTWGKLQAIEAKWYKRYCDEAIAYLTDENLTDAKTLEGFDLDTLKADLGRVTSV